MSEVVPASLRGFQRDNLFTQVITSVEVGIRKPHSAIFQHALEQLDIGADEAIYIGDTFVDDYQGATASGIKCFLLGPKERSC